MVLVGLNRWLKPFECHPKDPNSCFGRTLKLLTRPTAMEEPQLSHSFTPLSSDHDGEGMIEYHELTRSNPSGSDRAVKPSDEETKL